MFKHNGFEHDVDRQAQAVIDSHPGTNLTAAYRAVALELATALPSGEPPQPRCIRDAAQRCAWLADAWALKKNLPTSTKEGNDLLKQAFEDELTKFFGPSAPQPQSKRLTRKQGRAARRREKRAILAQMPYRDAAEWAESMVTVREVPLGPIKTNEWQVIFCGYEFPAKKDKAAVDRHADDLRRVLRKKFRHYGAQEKRALCAVFGQRQKEGREILQPELRVGVAPSGSAGQEPKRVKDFDWKCDNCGFRDDPSIPGKPTICPKCGWNKWSAAEPEGRAESAAEARKMIDVDGKEHDETPQCKYSNCKPVVSAPPASTCGEPAASLIPRLGMSWACALPPNHEGDCAPGGNCFKHGKYICKPNEQPQCPQWPDCISAAQPLAANPPKVEEALNALTSELGWYPQGERREKALAILCSFIPQVSQPPEGKSKRQLRRENKSLHERIAVLELARRAAEADDLVPPVTWPQWCHLCFHRIESAEDTEWHGLGNCVDICERCIGSGVEPLIPPAPPVSGNGLPCNEIIRHLEKCSKCAGAASHNGQGWVSQLKQLRDDGWMVAVHNDYRQDGKHRTFWLFTRVGREGHFVKGEGETDADALQQITRQLASHALPAPPSEAASNRKGEQE